MTTEPERRYDAFAPALYRYCWSLVGPQAADAALRRALLAAPRLAGELSDPDDLQPWLFALARTACRRHGFAAVSPTPAWPPPPRSGRSRRCSPGCRPAPARCSNSTCGTA
ncbi:hypothetical protein ACFQXA_30310 [Nocardiopsis composta]